MVDYHNDKRQQAGIQPLGLCPVLQEAARNHAMWMNRRRRMTHYGAWWSTPTSRVRAIDATLYAGVTENIAFAPGASVQEVFDQWLNSRGHARNALNPDFSRLGWYVSGAYWCCVYGRTSAST